MDRWARLAGLDDRMSGGIFALSLANLALLGLTLWALFSYRDAVDARSDARKLLLALDSTVVSLVDAESAQRGYLITADETYLGPYRAGIAHVETSLVELSRLVRGHARQERQLAAVLPVVHARQEELARSVARRGGDPREGDRLMMEVRTQIKAMRDDAVSRAVSNEVRGDELGTVLAMSSIAVTILSVGMVGALTFTQRRRVAAEVEHRAGLAKDEFVGFVSHELRGPIAVIAGNAQLLANTPVPLGPEEQASVEEILRGASRMDATVSTLMSLARAEAGGQIEVEPILIHRVAEGATRHHLTRYPDREIRLDAPDLVPTVLGERHAVEQVLLNLLQNAEKYGDRHAPIVVEIVPQGDVVEVHVQNQGQQLEREQFKHVFEAFFQLPGSARASGGVGLGLTVCQRLVRAQGGTMVAEALESGGACFSFRLRIAPESEEA